MDAGVPLLKQQSDLVLAINITVGSLCSDEFLTWLTEYLTAHAELKDCLLFEIPEAAIMKHKEHVTALVNTLQEHGFQWGLTIMVVTSSLWVIWKSWLRRMSRSTMVIPVRSWSRGRHLFLAAVCRAAHNAGVTTIATRVEDQHQVELLSKLHIDGYQGFVHPAFPLP